jgi:hypothetical protein
LHRTLHQASQGDQSRQDSANLTSDSSYSRASKDGQHSEQQVSQGWGKWASELPDEMAGVTPDLLGTEHGRKKLLLQVKKVEDSQKGRANAGVWLAVAAVINTCPKP